MGILNEKRCKKGTFGFTFNLETQKNGEDIKNILLKLVCICTENNNYKSKVYYNRSFNEASKKNCEVS